MATYMKNNMFLTLAVVMALAAIAAFAMGRGDLLSQTSNGFGGDLMNSGSFTIMEGSGF